VKYLLKDRKDFGFGNEQAACAYAGKQAAKPQT
jgi:hypothetical protein